jgi:hypothetical protein
MKGGFNSNNCLCKETHEKRKIYFLHGGSRILQRSLQNEKKTHLSEIIKSSFLCIRILSLIKGGRNCFRELKSSAGHKNRRHPRLWFICAKKCNWNYLLFTRQSCYWMQPTWSVRDVRVLHMNEYLNKSANCFEAYPYSRS